MKDKIENMVRELGEQFANPPRRLASIVTELHMIVGPNGQCRCGEDGLTCSQQLAMLSQDIQDALIQDNLSKIGKVESHE